jgi:hypothetical protein
MDPDLNARYRRRWMAAIAAYAALSLGCVVWLLVLLSGFWRFP